MYLMLGIKQEILSILFHSLRIYKVMSDTDEQENKVIENKVRRRFLERY